MKLIIVIITFVSPAVCGTTSADVEDFVICLKNEVVSGYIKLTGYFYTIVPKGKGCYIDNPNTWKGTRNNKKLFNLKNKAATTEKNC